MSLPSFITDTISEVDIANGSKLIPFDFDKNEILIKSMFIQTVENLEAIKNKILKILYTDKNLAPIYSDIEFGIDKESIIGFEYYSNIKVTETLYLDIKNQILSITGVNSINNFEGYVEDSLLTVSFSVDTSFGTIEVTT